MLVTEGVIGILYIGNPMFIFVQCLHGDVDVENSCVEHVAANIFAFPSLVTERLR